MLAAFQLRRSTAWAAVVCCAWLLRGPGAGAAWARALITDRSDCDPRSGNESSSIHHHMSITMFIQCSSSVIIITICPSQSPASSQSPALSQSPVSSALPPSLVFPSHEPQTLIKSPAHDIIFIFIFRPFAHTMAANMAPPWDHGTIAQKAPTK